MCVCVHVFFTVCLCTCVCMRMCDTVYVTHFVHVDIINIYSNPHYVLTSYSLVWTNHMIHRGLSS